MLILFYVLAILFLIIFPADTADTALHALTLWATNIVPILFPYMVFSKMLCSRLNSFHIPAFPFVAVLGLLGGSPSGAGIIAANCHFLSVRSLDTLCTLTGTLSPMFILGTVQTWIAYPHMGRRLFICHWLASASCAWIIWLTSADKPCKPSYAPEIETHKSFSPIEQSIDAIFQIGGCVILYSVLAGMIGKILFAFPFMKMIIHAILEVAGGVHAICNTPLAEEAKGILIAALLGFSGLSIISQNHATLKSLGISMRKLVSFAALRATLSAFIMALWSLIN